MARVALPLRTPLPARYASLSDAEKVERIQEHRSRLGDSLLILGHHYQTADVVALSDKIGDSFQLAREAAAEKKARHIVFCGVAFMAETAEILTHDDQVVLHPDMSAGCPLADMADADDVEEAWETIAKAAPGQRVVPITYVNSSSSVKAFCGRHGGVVCTSSNAERVLHWAFEQGDVAMFFPDKNLGWNTARGMGITPDEAPMWNPRQDGGGVTPAALAAARVVLWKGFCHVHTRFEVKHIAAARAKYPDAKIVVHPECEAPVVDAADAAGSTSFIIKYIEQAGPGATIGVGTERHMVERVAAEFTDRTVFPIQPSGCPNMAKVGLDDLLWTLDELGKVNVVTVPDEIAADARLALERMLTI